MFDILAFIIYFAVEFHYFSQFNIGVDGFEKKTFLSSNLIKCLFILLLLLFFMMRTTHHLMIKILISFNHFIFDFNSLICFSIYFLVNAEGVWLIKELFMMKWLLKLLIHNYIDKKELIWKNCCWHLHTDSWWNSHEIHLHNSSWKNNWQNNSIILIKSYKFII